MIFIFHHNKISSIKLQNVSNTDKATKAIAKTLRIPPSSSVGFETNHKEAPSSIKKSTNNVPKKKQSFQSTIGDKKKAKK